MTAITTPLLGFAAFSGTGKTTLLTQLIPILKQDGLRLAVIKHSHHDFSIDQPGKDSHRLRMAGANPVVLLSAYRQVVITERDPEHAAQLTEAVAALCDQTLDLILVEGFRDEAFPKIELHRPSLGKPLLYPKDPNIIAIASDQTLDTGGLLPCLDLNQPKSISHFIRNQFLTHTL